MGGIERASAFEHRSMVQQAPGRRLFSFQGQESFRRHGFGTQIAEDDLIAAVVELPTKEHLVLVARLDGFS